MNDIDEELIRKTIKDVSDGVDKLRKYYELKGMDVISFSMSEPYVKNIALPKRIVVEGKVTAAYSDGSIVVNGFYTPVEENRNEDVLHLIKEVHSDWDEVFDSVVNT